MNKVTALLSKRMAKNIDHLNKYYIRAFITECENDILNLKKSLNDHEKDAEKFINFDFLENNDIANNVDLKYSYINEIEELENMLSTVKRALKIFINDEKALEQIALRIEEYKELYLKITPSSFFNQTDFNYFQKDKKNDDYVKMQEIKKMIDDNFLKEQS